MLINHQSGHKSGDQVREVFEIIRSSYYSHLMSAGLLSAFQGS
ncbi:hypothetical protein [Pseudomonas sp. FG-3G]|nr:hypothetical protein [Pseudomonas sp. FG-3G]